MTDGPADGGDPEVTGRKVTVVGLGRFGGGVGVTRWLCRQGARVIVSDKASAAELAESVAALDGLDVSLHLGGHETEDFISADLLVVNPAVPKDLPQLRAARAAGVPHTSEINLFLQRCAAPVVGVTGSVGKSTTTAMTGAILRRRLKTHVGGNIGGSLLQELTEIRAADVVVLELSSFQLEDLPIIGASPHVAVVTNFAPNHLDRHGTVASYAAAKKNIFRFQSADDVLILNAGCEASAKWADEAPSRVEFFKPEATPFDLAVPGPHNQANAQAAWAAARQFGIDRQAAAEALGAFEGLAHRMQFIAESGGVRYYNDSKSTTPASTIAALAAFEPRRLVVIAGGYDKGLDFGRLGLEMAGRAKAVIAIGDAQQKIIAAVRRACADQPPIVVPAGDLREATDRARRIAEAGDAIVLSPACASYDMFSNYQQRGEAFVRIVTENA